MAGHIIPPSLLGGTLDACDPYATPYAAGDVAAARAEMASSAYDRDGVCDAAECRGVVAIVDEDGAYPAQAEILARSWREIGIELDIRTGDRNLFVYDGCLDPSLHWGVCPSLSWASDYPDAATFGIPLLDGSATGPSACCNFSLLGAAGPFLDDHGYAASTVPDVEEGLSACSGAPVGDERIACWATLDRTVMQDIVPVIPWLFAADVDVVSARLVHYRYDLATGVVALDHVAVAAAGA